MKYSNYTMEELIQDEKFCQWVLHPSTENDIFWENFKKNHPDKINDIEEARNFLLSLNFSDNLNDHEAEQEWDKICTKIKNHKKQQRSYTIIPQSYFKIAAALIPLAILSVIIYFLFIQSPAVHYETNYGEIRTIELPDNSKVVLNANSELTYEDNESERQVWLKGEAYFTVNRELVENGQLKRFIVHSNQVGIEVVGTQFNVNNRRDKTTVVLNSGLVKINLDQAKNSSIMMSPGQLAEISDHSNLSLKDVDTEHYTSWRKNILLAEKMSQIINFFEDNYGLQIDVQNPEILNKSGNVVLPLNQDLETLITILEETFTDISIKKDEKKLIFAKNR
ncbi:MAG: FecR family protein [Candidatus Cyclobacteriaceae bacterium M3_2C_046]